MIEILLYLSLFAIGGVELFEAKLTPIDLVAKHRALPLPSIDQIESGGDHLFLRSLRATEVIEINYEGQLIRSLGRSGLGPGEWGHGGVLAMGLYEDELWGFGTNNRTVNGFRQGAFIRGFPIDSITPGQSGTTSNVFGVSQTHVVLPSPFRTSFLAEIFLKTGEHVGHIGEPLEGNPEILEKNPFINDTMWIFNRNSWYGVFKFFPVILIFDWNFQPKTQLGLEDPWVVENFNKTLSDDPEINSLPLFSDIKIFKGRLYLMCRGRLLQIDPQTGSILSRTSFYGEGDEFGTLSGKPLSLRYFTLLKNGTLILAHPMLLWGHDLWKAEPPFSIDDKPVVIR